MNLFEQLSSELLNRKVGEPLLVAINGVDGSGKTEFTKQLAEILRGTTNRTVITISIDGFHNPRDIRYQKGRESAEGFYYDSFNLEAFKTAVLESLKNDEPYYVPQIFDVRADLPVAVPPQTVPSDAIVLIEGLFLFRKEFVSYFDLKIFLDVSFDIALDRMLERDQNLYESQAAEIELFEKRYKAGQLIYFSEALPKQQADIVIDNSNYDHPVIIKQSRT